MVYYYTSVNVKMLRNILIDFSAASEISPLEYMRSYIETCSEAVDEGKISWIADSFLGIQKHEQFLRALSSHFSDQLSKEEQDYFMIIFHALMANIEPKDSNLLYKSLFNLSKALLSILTTFLSNNEILNFISQVAQSSFDTNYITDKIIKPLFLWQPYISEMDHTFSEYNRKVETRKIKPLTVPLQLNVLNRKGKESTVPVSQVAIPSTPPNSIRIKSPKRMLTKNAIDQKLKPIYEKNKEKATNLLNEVRKNDYHYAQEKTDKYYKTLDNIRDAMENSLGKIQPKQKQKIDIKLSQPQHNIKETTATLKRMSKRIRRIEDEETSWLHDLLSCQNPKKVEQLIEQERQERERQRLLDIERKHLIGQISYEEALIAKKKILEENKRKYIEFQKEKEMWNEQIEKWKKEEVLKNQKTAEKASISEYNLIRAKQNAIIQKKETADIMKKESEFLLQKILMEKQRDLESKIAMIKEIKILSLVAKKSKVPRIIDLTESSGLGFLCEMSIAELQERLMTMKIVLQEELDTKKQMIKNENLASKQELENTKTSIKNYLAERAHLKNQNKKQSLHVEVTTSAKELEINDLKKTLEEKRKLRIQFTKQGAS